ncbi:MAG: Fe-S cluster assembly sulfur transfer protein SufU [Gemmatimonadota bacterium]
MPDSETPSAFDRSVPSSLSRLYQEVILDHYRRPRNKGPLPDATHRITMNNPLCGDIIDLHLQVDRDRVVDARFEGTGCSISQASASMMTARLKGKTVRDALRLAAKFTRLLHGDSEAAVDSELGDLRSLAGVSRFPVRIKCALLAWNCLEELVGKGERAKRASG